MQDSNKSLEEVDNQLARLQASTSVPRLAVATNASAASQMVVKAGQSVEGNLVCELFFLLPCFLFSLTLSFFLSPSLSLSLPPSLFNARSHGRGVWFPWSTYEAQLRS